MTKKEAIRWNVTARCDGCGRISTSRVTTDSRIEPGQSLVMGIKGTCSGSKWGEGMDKGTILGVAPEGCLVAYDEHMGGGACREAATTARIGTMARRGVPIERNGVPRV